MIIPIFIIMIILAPIIIPLILWQYGLFDPKKKQKIQPMMGILITLLIGILFLFLDFVRSLSMHHIEGMGRLMMNVFALAFSSFQSLIIFFILWRYLTTITLKDLLFVVGVIIFPPFIILMMILEYSLLIWLPLSGRIALLLITPIGQSILFALWFKNRKPLLVGALVAASCITWLLLLLLASIYS